jgi:small subunit ribosomal protein S17e
VPSLRSDGYPHGGGQLLRLTAAERSSLGSVLRNAVVPVLPRSPCPRSAARRDKVITATWVRTARMGNIRQTYIKRVAIELIRHYPNDFTGDFANNKQKVLELTDLGVNVDGKWQVVHKKLANRIAGYATRYVKRKRGT